MAEYVQMNELQEAVQLLKETSENQEKVMDEFCESQKKAIEALSNQVVAFSEKIGHLSSLTSKRLSTRIEFPKFTGRDFENWVYRSNQFFELDKTPDDMKVRLAAIHMEGKALEGHKKLMENHEEGIVWEDYVNEMEMMFRARKSGPSEKKMTEAETRRRPRRLICKFKQINYETEIQELCEDHPRFGPLYSHGEDESFALIKEKAWMHVLKNSPDREAVTTEIYLFAMRKVEKEARETYADSATDHMTGSQFRRMMIEDGCFFLQLALCMLGGPNQLLLEIFDGKDNNKFKDTKVWIEAMFFVGNQIPLVVLKELMKQSYFQEVLNKGKWERYYSDISRIALYELLLAPILDDVYPRAWTVFKDFFRNLGFTRKPYRLMQHQQPSDLLHCLHLQILGPEHGTSQKEEDKDEEEEEEEVDLEAAQYELDEEACATDEKISLATDLSQWGIYLCVLRGKGSRSICFTSNFLWASLKLPPLLVEDDFELMFRSLKNYEISQELGKNKREVSYYLKLMSELIRTPDDVKVLTSSSIIRGSAKHRVKLPSILKRLSSGESYDLNLHRVKLEVSDYSVPLWKKYWHVFSIAVILTALQTVYTILPYYKE